MKSLFLDIQLGASGDMLIGSLLDLGLDHGSLVDILKRSGLDGWKIDPVKTSKFSLAGTSANISAIVDKNHRNLDEILSIIRNSGYSSLTTGRIEKVFETLARAEAAVHGVTINDIHFHETGAIDSIIDISAFCIAMELLEIEHVYFNTFHFGTGTINTAHGVLPVPVPATVSLTNGYRCVFTDKKGELVTPSAAAILTSLGTQKNTLPPFITRRTGTGFGTRDYGFLSCTRSFIVEESITTGDQIYQVECNIDDMNPQLIPDVINRLMKAGALDAYCTQVLMKKGRPGFLFTILVMEYNLNDIRRLLYGETTTLGLRIHTPFREKISRDFISVTVKGEKIGIKVGSGPDGLTTIHPEYEDCKKTAEKHNLSLKRVFYLAEQEYYKNNPLQET